MLRFNMQKLEDDKEPIDPKKWHQWFAWHPVKINDKWYWFKTVYRKEGIYAFYKKGAGHMWEYALDMFDVLKKIKENPYIKDPVARSFAQAQVVLPNISIYSSSSVSGSTVSNLPRKGSSK